jgi:hypothetical protein
MKNALTSYKIGRVNEPLYKAISYRVIHYKTLLGCTTKVFTPVINKYCSKLEFLSLPPLELSSLRGSTIAKPENIRLG